MYNFTNVHYAWYAALCECMANAPAMHTERPLYSSTRYTLRVHVYHVLYAVGCGPMASGTRAAMLFDYRALGVARALRAVTRLG